MISLSKDAFQPFIHIKRLLVVSKEFQNVGNAPLLALGMVSLIEGVDLFDIEEVIKEPARNLSGVADVSSYITKPIHGVTVITNLAVTAFAILLFDFLKCIWNE